MTKQTIGLGSSRWQESSWDICKNLCAQYIQMHHINCKEGTEPVTAAL